MDIITSTTTTPTTTNVPKTSEPESETPTRIQQPITTTKPLSFSNGVLKRHHHPYHHLANPGAAMAAPAVTYKECLKNHAASLGGHALDGCGEFMPAPTVTAGDPASIKCAACGCHRNFHRRESDEPPLSPVLEYQSHHRHQPLPPPPPPPFHPPNNNHHHPRSPSSASPPPISSSYYPSAPHMLLALSSGGGLPIPPENTAAPASTMNNPLGSRKRFRTKFTPEQKEKMHRFAERVGWKMQKSDEDLVQEFCYEVGVDRGVLKVWMHNNKNTFGKRDLNASGDANITDNANANANANAIAFTVTPSANANNYDVVGNRNLLEHAPQNNNNGNGNALNGEINGDASGNDDDSGANGGGSGTNASSSSS